jgi:hypothetical protein
MTGFRTASRSGETAAPPDCWRTPDAKGRQLFDGAPPACECRSHSAARVHAFFCAMMRFRSALSISCCGMDAMFWAA